MYLPDFLPENTSQRLIQERFLILKLPEAVWQNVRGVFAAACPFFQETLEVKSACILPQDMGYRPFGGEYSQSPSFPDQLESFSVCARVPIAPSDLPSSNARRLCERMSRTFDSLEPLAETLIIELVNKLSLKPIGEQLRGKLRYWSRLQLNYSRPAIVTLPFVNELHEDLNLLTITCASEPGLELQLAENEFASVTTKSREALVFPGEIAWLLSGGRLRPVYHRVRPNPEIRERLALLFFADPEPSSCEPWISNEVNCDVDIGARVLTNVSRFGLKGFTVEQNEVSSFGAD